MKKSIYFLISFALCFFSKTGNGQERIIYLKGTAPCNMYSSNLDGTDEVLITTGVSNGNRCGFKQGKIYYTSGSSIHKINMDGTGHAIIPNTSDVYGEINVSPSDDKIVYCGGPNNYYLYIIDTSGTNKILLNNGQPVSLHQTGPSWNTVGTIYFVQSNYGNPYTQKIYSKPDNDPSAVPVLLTPSFAQEPNSGGPNNLILFNNGSGNLVTMDPDGSNQVILSGAGSGNSAKGAWHLSDSTFYYMHDNNIWKIKFNNTGNAQITTAGGFERVIGFGTMGPAVTITASVNPVCSGDPVTFTAMVQPPASNVTFDWYVNGIKITLPSGGTSSYSYVPQPGDLVYCVATIPGSPPVTINSNTISMTVNPLPYDIAKTTGLAAYYPFNGNANDESGNGNSTTVYGATLTTDRFGKPDSAYYFDGVNDYIVVNNDTLGNLINYSTISFWAYIDSDNFNNGDHFIIAKDRGPYWMYQIMANIDSLNLGIYPGAHWFRFLGKNQVINNWHMFTFSKELGLYKVYFDGQLVTEYDAIINENVINSGPICMGKSYYWNGLYFKGKLDEVRINTRTLSSEEIACLYSGNCSTLQVELEPDTIYSGDNTSLKILNSQAGIKYQLKKDGVDYGNDQTGNGALISFPITYLTETSSFTVLATDPATGCSRLLDSTFTVTVLPIARDLHLTLFLEGLYNPVTQQMNKAQDESGDEFPGTIADKIDVLMAGKEYPYPVLYSVMNASLNQDGSCWVAIPRIGVYYLVIRHRNSIETWSSAPVSFAIDPIVYDFSSLADAAFGNNMRNMSGTWAIWTGDINQDGIVDSGDMNYIDNASTAVTYGYVTEDVNGDGIVDVGDMNLTDNNNTAVVIAITP